MVEPLVNAAEQRLIRAWPGAATQDIVPNPSLDDLLDDPIMLLLWRGDGLEPSEARAVIHGLLAAAWRSRSAANGLLEPKRCRRRRAIGIAA